MDFARDGRTIASGSGDRTVRLWDIEAGQNILTLSIEDGVTTVAISPDTKLVAAGSLDKSVRVWDATSGYLVERLEGPDGHKDSVYSVAFAPNGKDLVSGSLDKTIKMWELVAPRGGHPNNAPKGGRCIRTFEGHKVCFNDHTIQISLTLKRTLFSLLLSLQMEIGFFLAPRIVESSSGTRELATLNSCCKATRTASFPWRPVQLVDLLQQEVEICAQEFGLTSRIKVLSLDVTDSKSSDRTPGTGTDIKESLCFFGGFFRRASKRVKALGYNDRRTGMRLGYQMYSLSRIRANGSAYFWGGLARDDSCFPHLPVLFLLHCVSLLAFASKYSSKKSNTAKSLFEGT